jgi:hypothetical protein
MGRSVTLVDVCCLEEDLMIGQTRMREGSHCPYQYVSLRSLLCSFLKAIREAFPSNKNFDLISLLWLPYHNPYTLLVK